MSRNLLMRNPSITHRRFGVIHRSASTGNTARKLEECQGIVCAKTVQSIDNPSIKLWKPSTDVSPNRPIIDRRNRRTDRSGCRNRSVESSRNRQIDSPVDRSSASPNRKVIVNRFAVIVNSAARNLSPIHHQNTELYHRAGRPPAIRLLEASDNHPTKRRNHPTDSANLPIINRQIFAIYRSFHTNKLRAQLRKHAPLPPVA